MKSSLKACQSTIENKKRLTISRKALRVQPRQKTFQMRKKSVMLAMEKF